MNWGKNLTLLGAMRLSGWVQLNTMFESTNKDRFIAWLVTKLLPRLTAEGACSDREGVIVWGDDQSDIERFKGTDSFGTEAGIDVPGAGESTFARGSDHQSSASTLSGDRGCGAAPTCGRFSISHRR